jgi:rod shape-determining protein MreB
LAWVPKPRSNPQSSDGGGYSEPDVGDMSVFGNWFAGFSVDIAVDLGTANTVIFLNDKGIVVNEPSVVAINQITGEYEAFGREAKEMLGRTPQGIVAIHPIQDGVIANFTVAESLLRRFITKAVGETRFMRCRIVIGVPSVITPVEKRAVVDSAFKARAGQVFLVNQAMVAAIGAGLPVTEPVGSMIVDIGGGTTDIAVISLSGIVHSNTVRVAGNSMDAAIVNYVRKKYDLIIGERTAEQLKIEIGSAAPLDLPLSMKVAGRSRVEGLPKSIVLSDTDVREAIAESIDAILMGIRTSLDKTPPELCADIGRRGLTLTGGGALLKNLDRKIRNETGVPVHVADDPLNKVVCGTAAILKKTKLLRRMAIDPIPAVE